MCQTLVLFQADMTELVMVALRRNGKEAGKIVAALHPDPMLMDIRTPVLKGPDATRQIKQQPSPPSVMFVSAQDGAGYREAAQSMEADDFQPKTEIVPEGQPMLE
jgi:CheY-like chemotaxis protein